MFGRVYRVRRDRHLLGYDGNHGLARLLQDRPRNQVVYAIACSVASVVGLHLVLGALSLQGSRTSSHVQKGFIPEERLRRRAGSSTIRNFIVASSGVHAQLPGLRPSEVSSDLLNWVPALFVKLHKRRHLDRGTRRTHSGAQTCKAIHHSRFHRRTDE